MDGKNHPTLLWFSTSAGPLLLLGMLFQDCGQFLSKAPSPLPPSQLSSIQTPHAGATSHRLTLQLIEWSLATFHLPLLSHTFLGHPLPICPLVSTLSSTSLYLQGLLLLQLVNMFILFHLKNKENKKTRSAWDPLDLTSLSLFLLSCEAGISERERLQHVLQVLQCLN